MTDARVAARARAAALRTPADRPSQRRCSVDMGTPAVARAPLSRMEFRDLVDANGNPVLQFNGYATVTEREYEMWDFFGPYTEEVAGDAPSKALSSNPDVAFLINHRGMTLARTKSGTLTLGADSLGMPVEAMLDPRNSDVANLRIAMERRDIDEMSFAFAITRGQWNDDYTKYRIEEFDIDRGDVSVVNYGANPFTSAALRGKSATRNAGLFARVQSNNLTDADTKTLTALLAQLAVADSALDPIVDVILGADMALDAGQLALSTLLGLPNPDDIDADRAAASDRVLRGFAPAQLRGLERTLRSAMRANGLTPLPTFEDVR